jgi:hypothetical protein
VTVSQNKATFVAGRHSRVRRSEGPADMFRPPQSSSHTVVTTVAPPKIEIVAEIAIWEHSHEYRYRELDPGLEPVLRNIDSNELALSHFRDALKHT